MTSKTARFALRAATAPDHERVDRAFSGFDLRDPDQYRAFLTAQATAFQPVEAGIDRVDLRLVLPDWPTRRRSPELIADLADLDTAPASIGDIPTYDGVATALGAAYVLEGSRLGGTLLLRMVPEHLPRRFLGASNSSHWQKFVEVIDMTLVSDDELAAAIDAARAVFARFEASARCH